MLNRTFVLLAATLLSGCGWFDSSAPSPLHAQRLRPGAERQATTIGLPPASQRGTYDSAVPPADETRGQPVGAVVTSKGGQKAQLETREQDRIRREAEQNREKERRLSAQPAAQPPDPTTSDR